MSDGAYSKTRLVVGCGYLGERVATHWQQRGDRVIGVTRRQERAAELRSRGLETLCFDVTRPDTFPDIPPLDTLLMAVAFDPAGGLTREIVCLDGLRNVLDAINNLTDRLIYISTTGVFGQDDGSWVDEQSPCQPQREAGRVYLAAERMLSDHRWGQQAVILRLAGIYGPGRVPYLVPLQTGQPLPVEVEGFLNLIHVEDAARAVLACEHCATPELLLVSDGRPVCRQDFYREVARLVGTEVRFSQPELGSPRSERAQSNKRISNRKLMERLAFRLVYPSYQEGLAAILS